MTHSSLCELNTDSVVADLPASDFTVAPDAIGRIVAHEFQQQPDLPGVLIRDGATLLGMISREKFLEHLSRPYGLELYMKRPIQVLLEVDPIAPLILPAETGIDEATRIALSRPRDLVYEPVVIVHADGQIRMQSLYMLLRAQSQLLAIANQTIRRQKDAADAANQAKSVFLANMSHEIRTPMNGVMGLTEILLDTPLSSEQHKHLQLIRESANSLLNVINDILDFSKIEAGHLELEKVEFRLRDVVAESLAPLSLRAHRKGLELASRIQPLLPEILLGDPMRLRQIIINLVNNAIKFTERGEIVIDVDARQQESRFIDLHIGVRDTGIGIPSAKQSEIFEAFSQADASTTCKFGGTGLGLAICRRLTELMNGSMWVESEAERGSTFHFTVQFELPEIAEESSAPAKFWPDDLPVLVVDDNAASREILKEMLENWRLKPVLAESVLKAEEVLAATKQAIPLAIIDAAMPEQDGFVLAERLARRGPGSPRTVMLLSGSERGFDIDRCQRLGVTAFVTKPIKQSNLFDALASAACAPAIDRVIEPANDELQVLRRTILLVEDGLVNQTVALGMLQPRGHAIVVANNGREALDLHSHQSFDLILMDVQMPDMDGLEATATIRSREIETGKHTPIVAMTAHAMSGDRERCLQAGMDAYITKPFRKHDLLEIVEGPWIEEMTADVGSPSMPKLCRESLSEVVGSNQDRAEFIDAVSSSVGIAEPRQDARAIVFDADRALAAVGDDEALLRSVVGVFVEESPNLLAALQRGVAEHDVAQVRLAAHTLKGSMSLLGIEPLRAAFERLETAGKSGEVAMCGDTLAKVIAGISLLLPALNEFLNVASA